MSEQIRVSTEADLVEQNNQLRQRIAKMKPVIDLAVGKAIICNMTYSLGKVGAIGTGDPLAETLADLYHALTADYEHAVARYRKESESE